MFSKLKMLSIVAAMCALNAHAAVFYVKAGAPGGDGSTWAKAFNNLDAALNAARANSVSDQIWVAAGTYTPTSKYVAYSTNPLPVSTYAGTEANLATFKLPSNVAIYGGFAGNETKLSARNLSANPTILSGNLGGGVNAYHILTADGVTGVVLDSFIVRDGLANGTDAGSNSGFNQFNLLSLDFTLAAGAGLLARNGALVTLSNTKFINNTTDASHVGVGTNPALGNSAAASGGAAIAATDDNTLVTITGSTFDHNNSTGLGGNGGALTAMLEASFNISSSVFSNNSAVRIGGAIHGKNAGLISVASSVLQNNFLTGSAVGDESGGAIGTVDSNLTITGSQFSGNVSGVTSGGGAILFHAPFDDHEAYALNVSSSSFSNNVAAIVGGGAINITGFQPNAATYAKIANSSFTNNQAFNGGAMYIDGIPTTVVNSSFVGNQAYSSGGAIFEVGFSHASQLPSGTINLSNRVPTSITNSSFVGNSIVPMPSSTPISPFCAGLTDPNQISVCGFGTFAFVLSIVFTGTPSSSVSAMPFGGGAIASSLGGDLTIANSSFKSNSAPNGSGGALLIGGSAGTPLAMGQDYVKISNSSCSGNTALVGGTSWLKDAEGLNPSGPTPSSAPFVNGVYFATDGSCRLGK